jgi:vWA-MoxR associated protein C-terminal domain
MTTLCAVLIGIDRYEPPDWNVSGPCANAIAVADWLLSLEGVVLKVQLFLAPADAPDTQAARTLEGDIKRLQAAGVTVTLQADHATLEKYLRVTLREAGWPPRSQLLISWSGHGCTGKRTDDRFFYCSDYVEALPSRAFNGSNLLRLLRTNPYACFDNQIFLADVCGTYTDVPVDDRGETHQQNETPQLALFATPDGQYAKGPEGRGVFTDAALGVLRRLGTSWSDHDRLTPALLAELEKVGQKPLLISGLRNTEVIRERRVGTVDPALGNPHFKAAHALLTELDVVRKVFWPHYLRTVAELGMPELTQAQGLIGVVKELSSLGDGQLRGGLPRGLLEFLLRLAREPSLKDPITVWLDTHAASQHNTRAEISRKLEVEAEVLRILMIVVDIDAQSMITGYTPHLCYHDGSFVEEDSSTRYAVHGWDDFVRSLQQVFGKFVVDGELQNLQIHFVVDTPLFDRPFHQIPLAPGQQSIGAGSVVIVRARKRMQSGDLSLHNTWHDYIDALRALPPDQIEWLRADENGPLPNGRGLYFAAFRLTARAADPASGRGKRDDILRRLLKLGVPCIYLPQGDSHAGDWNGLGRQLADLVRPLNHVEKLADRFLHHRIQGNALAEEAALLWDDPDYNPFMPTLGVTKQ